MAAFSPHCQLCNFCINCWLELRYDFCHTELLIHFESIHVADGSKCVLCVVFLQLLEENSNRKNSKINSVSPAMACCFVLYQLLTF